MPIHLYQLKFPQKVKPSCRSNLPLFWRRDLQSSRHQSMLRIEFNRAPLRGPLWMQALR